MDSAYRVCFVCTGNICRSPAAEVVVRELVEQAGLTGVELDSSGTDGWHVGAPADPRALRALTAAGYNGDPLIDVADPYYDGDAEFTVMVQQIEAAGAGLLEHLARERG